MPIGLGNFQSFVDNNPQADRLALNETADQPGVENARSGNMLTWAIKVIGEYTPWQWNAVTAQNNDAITAFRSALSAEYGNAALDHAPASNTGQPLTSRHINAAVHGAKAAIYEAAIKPDASAAERKTALDTIMRGVALTPGPLGPMMSAEVGEALLDLLPTVMPLDGTPRLDLIGKLGTQLVARMEDHLARALDAYADRKDVSVEALIAKLGAGESPMLELAKRVPAMRAHLDADIQGFKTSIETLLGRVGADHAGIGARFLAGRFSDGPDAGLLTDIQLTNSDPHKGGNRVAILSFEAGLTVVYKPRDVRIDDAISGSDRGSKGPSLMQQAGATSVYKFMPKSDGGGDYGYVQHLPNREAANHVVEGSRAPAMFQDLGRAVAALMVSGATDIHHENMMVSNGSIYFTDLEFALNADVMGKFGKLLTSQPPAQPKQAEQPTNADEVPEPPQGSRELKSLMTAIMLDQAFTSATDDNVLHARRTFENGQLKEASAFQDVPESLLIVHSSKGEYVNNRYTPDLPNRPFYEAFGPAFGDGLASGLAALKKKDSLTTFLNDVQGLNMRYHPLSTTTQRSILQSVFEQDYHPAEIGDHAKALDGMRATLRGVRGIVDDEAKRELLASTMEAAYEKHDIPYYSRKIGDTALLPDGQVSDKPGCAGFFPADIDAHADQLNNTLQNTPDSKLKAIGEDAGRWLSSQTPSQEFAMSLVSPQECDDMIQTATRVRPMHR